MKKSHGGGGKYPPPTIVIGLTKCKNAHLKKGEGEIDKDAQIDKVNILERIYIYGYILNLEFSIQVSYNPRFNSNIKKEKQKYFQFKYIHPTLILFDK